MLLTFSILGLFAQNSGSGLNSDIETSATAFVNSLSNIKVSFELFCGGNISTFTGLEDRGSVKAGIQVGLGGKISSSENKLSVMPQLVLISKGTKETIQGGFIERTENPIYLEIPIKVGYTLNPIKTKPRFGLTLYAGPYFAYGLGGKHKAITPDDSFWGSVASDNITEFFKDGYGQRFDCGLVLGLRAGDEFFFDLSYERGLTKVFDLSNSICNSSFLFGIGFRF